MNRREELEDELQDVWDRINVEFEDEPIDSDDAEFCDLWDRLSELKWKILTLCRCGNDDPYERYDGNGIYIMRVCDPCWEEKSKGYRPEVLSGPYDENLL